MTDTELGEIAYKAAAEITNCTQPWSEANQHKWIAAAKAVADHLANHWGSAVGKAMHETR